MINLLIVDDEIFTREGIMEILPLEDLNITKVISAFDGLDALEQIKTFKPDILLTDVRMPRMNGIDLAFEVRKIYPDTSIIFMSGYSDKEYLKSAIKLKAISYVEKPIEPEELESAVRSAILENSKCKTINNNIEDSIAIEMTNSLDISKLDNILILCASEKLKTLLFNSSFLTVLISAEDTIVENSIISSLKSTCKVCCLDFFISKKSDSLIVVQLLFSKNSTFQNIKMNLSSLFASFDECLKEHFNYFIGTGKLVYSLNETPDSFLYASKAINHKFFYDYNSVIYSCDKYCKTYTIDPDILSKLDNSLNTNEIETLKRLIKNLTSDFKNSIGTPISYVKDSYYRIVQHIMNHGSIRNTFHKKEIYFRNILESILECNNLFDLENIVIKFIDDISLILNDSSKKNLTVPSILEYIHKNYSNTNLCLDDISKNTYLTPTYICVIFKDQMSKTVNKYITEYRIEKAKVFLKDSNIKMSDIAGKVGYNDPNYFSKIFRKETSYTPSEYRRYFTSEI